MQDKDFEDLKQINLQEKYQTCLLGVQNTECLFSKKLIKSLIDESGFSSSDPNTYKTIGLLSEKLLCDMLNNISMLNRKKQKDQIQQEQNKKQSLKGRKLTLKNVIDEFEEKGLSIFKAPFIPHSDLMVNYLKQQDQNN